MASSLWLQYIADGLSAAGTIAQCTHCNEQGEQAGDTNGADESRAAPVADWLNVVVHGGEGTDTTLLVASLAQILLNPDSRTIRG